MDGVINPHVLGHAVLGASSTCDINLTANGTGAELLPGARQVCFRYNLLSFMVNLKTNQRE